MTVEESSMITLEEACNRYYVTIQRYVARRYSCADYIRDCIVQDVFVRLSAKWNTLESHREISIVSWLYSTAQNVIKEYIKASVKEAITMDVDTEVIENIADPDDRLEKSDRDYDYHILLQYIQSNLSPKEWELFNLCYIESVSIDKLKEIYGKNENCIYQKKFKLRKRVQQVIIHYRKNVE